MEPKTCPHSTCRYQWTPRKANPVKCPQCQNPLWKSSRPKKTGSGELETQRTAVVDKLYASSPTLQESNPASPTTVEMVFKPRSEWPESVVKKLDEAISSKIDECVRAPIEEKDSLSQMKQRAESLLSKLI